MSLKTQYAHCKCCSLCRYFHTQETCFIEKCDKLTCTSRHPRLYLYLSQFGHCQFGTVCSNLHISDPLENNNNIDEIKTPKESLQEVFTASKEWEIQIEKLKEKSNDLETKIDPTKALPDKKSFTCHLWDYNIKSKTVLKQHISMKHNEYSPTPEKERRKEQDSSHQMIIDAMAEALFCFDLAEFQEVGLHLTRPNQETFIQCNSYLQEEINNS